MADATAALPEITKYEPIGKWPRPWLFFILALPYGVFQGFLQTPLPILLRNRGISTGEIANIVSILVLPSSLYFLWSPLVDFLVRRRTWLVLSAFLSGVLLFAAIVLFKGHIGLAKWLLFLGFAINMMSSAANGGLMATVLSDAGKAKASGWYQAGSLAASALGGGVLLFFAEHLSVITDSLIAAAMVAIPAIPALTIPELVPHNSVRQLGDTLWAMWREVRTTLLTWQAVPALLLIMAPVGTGAAMPLFASMAREYQVGSTGVVLLNGVAGGLLTMLGSLLATLAPVHWDRRVTYALSGGLNAVSGVMMMLLPMKPWTYILCVSLYLITTGVCYSAFTALVLHMLGHAGRSASSRYTILVSLSNLAIILMTWAEGIGYNHFGARGVPGFDAAGNLIVCVLVLGAWLWNRGKQPGNVAA